MPLNVSYMGTKRKLANQVASIVDSSADGPFLDLFAGMCAVSKAVSPARSVWCNDVQSFASEVATAFFASSSLSCTSDEAANLASGPFHRNSQKLRSRFAAQLQKERTALIGANVQRIRALERMMPNVATDASLSSERAVLARRSFEMPYRLFSITYSGGYFGLEQCIEIDSIRYAIDQLRVDGKISNEDHRWLCLGLCQAISKVATTTGHFAQHMRANEHNHVRFTAQRYRSVWYEWVRALGENYPIGTRKWRAQNRVFNRDANDLLDELKRNNDIPAVVYADPPYTRDQYSRFYHIYDTIIEYDYPTSTGSGRYRPNRFQSPYCMKTRVAEAMNSLISSCAQLGCTLILSYPDRGLLPHSTQIITSSVVEHYGHLPNVHSVTASHSSFGASKGRQNYHVQEQIYVTP